MSNRKSIKNKVTAEMIAAGVRAFDRAFLAIAPYEKGKMPDVAEIFCAMEEARLKNQARPGQAGK